MVGGTHSQFHLKAREVKFKKERVRVGLDLFEAAQSSKNLNKKTPQLSCLSPNCSLSRVYKCMRFSHCEELTLVDQTKLSLLKMKHNAENACVNRMWQLGFSDRKGSLKFNVKSPRKAILSMTSLIRISDLMCDVINA